MRVVEKAQELWYKWVPGWLPVFLALLWIAMQYQRIEDRLDIQDAQIKAIQEYLRSDHQKTSSSPFDPGISFNRQQPQQMANDPSIER